MPLKYDKDVINEYAKKEGFIRDTLEKVMRLAEVLSFISENEMLSKNLVLKGGTAINLFYLDNMPRLSVDIDLDYTNPSRDVMLSERPRIRGQIEKYMFAAGYELSGSSKTPDALDSFVYKIENAGNVRDNIKIEINYGMRSHVLPFQRTTLETLGCLKEATISSVAPEELFASKTVALLSRTASRDLFDLYNVSIQYGETMDKDMYRKCVVFYSATNGNTSTKFDLDCLDKLTPYVIKKDLLPFLRRGQHVDLDNIKTHVRDFLTETLCFKDNEKEFLEKFSEGRYVPELIFGKNCISEKMKEHPMANWKIQKIQEQIKGIKIEDAAIGDSRYSGKICNITDNYFAQQHGTSKIIRHHYVNVDKADIKLGDDVIVRYKNGRGNVSSIPKEKGLKGELEL